MTAADTARRAAEIMGERGHCKHIEEDEEGRVCFIGAVNLASAGWSQRPLGVRFEGSEAETILITAAKVLAKRHGDTVSDWYRYGPILWNNRSDITGEDVIMLLKETAEELETENA